MPACPVCRAQAEESAYIETYTSSFNNQEYKLYHCKTCDLQWWEPLKIVPEFYEQEGEEAYAIFHMGINEKIGENHKMFFKHIPVKSGRLLDVGCGDGVFLQHAQRVGFDVWGIDFDSKSIKVCQEKRGLKNTFVATPWEFADYCEKNGIKFDVITFFEVLEHQDDPVGFLEAVKKMLKPGGWIAGSVPNRESWYHANITKKLYPKSDFPPNHFIRFSEKSLSNTLRSCGFQVELIRDTPIVIKNASAEVRLLLLGKSLDKAVRQTLFGSPFASAERCEKGYKKLLYMTLKSASFTVFFLPALAIKFYSRGPMLYFQAKTSI